jgi:hypothetical protein|tara:strand:- start:425 stop:865 length:441 start_codon:yes stop_codon:yes gene_type:complete
MATSNVTTSRAAAFIKEGAAKLVVVQKHEGQGADKKLVAEFEALSPAGETPDIRLKHARAMFGAERLINIIDNQLPIMQRSAWLAYRGKHSIAKCKELMREWLPDTSVKGKADPIAKAKKSVATLSSADKAALIAELQAQIDLENR